MHRELFRIPLLDLPVHSFGAMVLLGFLSGYFYLGYAARRAGIPHEKIQDLPLWIVPSGLLGGRLFYFVQFYDSEFSAGRWWRFFKIWEGGLVFYGGVLLAAAAYYVYCRRNRLPLLPMLDAIAPALALGFGFGRIGCFLNGCCFGRACAPGFPLEVRFPPHSPPAEYGDFPSAPIHPTQLYDSLNGFLLALLLWACWRQPHRPGAILALLAIGYGTSRFIIEAIRGDHGVPAGAWTIGQWISSACVLLGLALLWWTGRRSVRATIAGEPAPLARS